MIDTHFHVYTGDTPLQTDRWNHREWPAPEEAALTEFAAAGVTHGVMVTASEYAFDRADFARALSAYSTLRATTNLPPDAPASQMRALDVQGFVGMRLHWRPLTEAPDPESAEWQRLFRLCADIGWHVHITERPARLERLLRAVERSGARIVIDHMGFVDSAEGADDPHFLTILRAMERGQTWVTLSGGFRFKACDPDQQARALVAAGGWERVMWGSDWPFVGYHGKLDYCDAVAALHRQVPEPEIRDRIARETAERFYFDR